MTPIPFLLAGLAALFLMGGGKAEAKGPNGSPPSPKPPGPGATPGPGGLKPGGGTIPKTPTPFPRSSQRSSPRRPTGFAGMKGSIRPSKTRSRPCSRAWTAFPSSTKPPLPPPPQAIRWLLPASRRRPTSFEAKRLAPAPVRLCPRAATCPMRSERGITPMVLRATTRLRAGVGPS